jgi:hypothetical protein
MPERLDWATPVAPERDATAIRDPFTLLITEAEAMLTRVDRVMPFALHETMVPAASISPEALTQVESFLVQGRRVLRARLERYLAWVRSGAGTASPVEAQQAFVLLRLEFNDVLSQVDLFAEVISQRSAHRTGVWLAGLDVAAADALRVDVPGLSLPEVVTYLDRGPGAAIRRARTRLPGGAKNPVAIVRVPRERMVGSGIASSLMHEVGHQAAALLCLVETLRHEVAERRVHAAGPEQQVWALWERWVSEIVADLWSVAHVGVSSLLGLIQVVSLPKAFVFRVGLDDPHPVPWIRVLLCSAFGAMLYPHPQWQRLAGLWAQLYPLDDLEPSKRRLFLALQATMPEVVRLFVTHRSDPLGGRPLTSLLPIEDRQPQRLTRIFDGWRQHPQSVHRSSPSLAFAVIGQAKADGDLSPGREAELVSGLLRRWAFERALATGRGRRPRSGPPAAPGRDRPPAARPATLAGD